MTAQPNYRFQFCIIDKTSGETICEDYCGLTSIDQFGACESIDMHVSAMLRAFERSVRAQYEEREYRQPARDAAELQFIGGLAARLRAVAERG